MTVPAFDTLAFVKRLIAVGVAPEQAEVQAELQSQILSELVTKLATKEDLHRLEDGLETKIGAVDAKLNWLVSLVGLVGIMLAGLNLWHIFQG